MNDHTDRQDLKPLGYPGKRLFDVVVAVVLLILLAPVFLIVALCVKVSVGSPVFFRQQRTGWRGAMFELIKFRTMSDTRGPEGQLLADGERLTATGRVLRKASLDELPELISVVRGDMSLVGPRPLFARYLPAYRPAELARFEARPGITGLAQVMGRNMIGWDQRLAHDVEYVENMSFRQDVEILIKTIRRVLTGAGVEVNTALVEKYLDEERESGADSAGEDR